MNWITGKSGLWLDIQYIAARCQCEASATGQPVGHRWTGSEDRFFRDLERVLGRIVRRTAISCRVVLDLGHVAVQTRAALHIGRSGRRLGHLTHGEHWPNAQATFHAFSVHRRVLEGWHVQQCQCTLHDQVRRWNVDNNQESQSRAMITFVACFQQCTKV